MPKSTHGIAIRHATHMLKVADETAQNNIWSAILRFGTISPANAVVFANLTWTLASKSNPQLNFVIGSRAEKYHTRHESSSILYLAARCWSIDRM
jgi:hypothetical protein